MYNGCAPPWWHYLDCTCISTGLMYCFVPHNLASFHVVAGLWHWWNWSVTVHGNERCKWGRVIDWNISVIQQQRWQIKKISSSVIQESIQLILRREQEIFLCAGWLQVTEWGLVCWWVLNYHKYVHIYYIYTVHKAITNIIVLSITLTVHSLHLTAVP